jgi:hypothetical protein
MADIDRTDGAGELYVRLDMKVRGVKCPLGAFRIAELAPRLEDDT